MNLLYILKDAFIPPKANPLDSNQEDRKLKCTIPKDIELKLKFPSAISTNEEKVIFSLWKEGKQSFFNLVFLTGLKSDELIDSLQKLSKQNIISKEQSGFFNRFEMDLKGLSFAIVKAT